MQKSIIERVFPRPKRPLLPQYDDSSSTYHDEEYSATSVPGRMRLDSNMSRTSTSRSSRRSSHGSQSKSHSGHQLQPAPLSASIIHHDDPFLSVDRAAATLQRTIQSLLDFQSQALSGRHQNEADDTSTQRSASPTQSRTNYSTSTHDFSGSNVGTMPVRQPKQKKTTLRGARRGLVKSMQDFAILKEEELKITNDESIHRRTALDRIVDLETKREAIQHEMQILQEQTGGNDASSLRSEARSVEQEIHELEGRLMELKGRHRQLTDRATQLENTAASELSSYEGTLALIDKETKSFLKRPPVKEGLTPRNLSQQNREQDMYSLRPERRTLNMAKEQWIGELELLETHKTEIERERAALVEGGDVWKETVQRIDTFEQNLRTLLRAGNSDATLEIVQSLDATMHFLQEKLSRAEAQDWKLLVCAIGAEFEAFKQARALLVPGERSLTIDQHSVNGGSGDAQRQHLDEEDSDVPHADLLGAQSPELTSSHLVSSQLRKQDLLEHTHDLNGGAASDHSNSNSNESLKATLHAFPPSSVTSSSVPNMRRNESTNSAHGRTASASASNSKQFPQRRMTRYSESSDDDPGPDFLISH